MTKGMQHREEVEEYVAELDLEYIDEGNINEAIGQLNTGKDETTVYAGLEALNEEIRCECLHAADFEERAYGRRD
jgi:uncharacterized Fe-S cluster-containing MiaB family protein